MEDITDWIPALTTSSALVMIAFLCRKLISTRLTNSVRHEYDIKLAEINSKISSKQLEIESIRSGTLHNLSERQNVLFKRQLEAIEKLWSIVLALKPAKEASGLLNIIPYDLAINAAKEHPHYREFFSKVSSFDLAELPLKEAEKERPFITPMAWAYFSAYLTITRHAAIKMHAIKNGLDIKEAIDANLQSVLKLTQKTLPNRAQYIEKKGESGLHKLLDELEECLLSEFDKTFNGKETDKNSIAQAAEIIKLAKELQDKY